MLQRDLTLETLEDGIITRLSPLPPQPRLLKTIKTKLQDCRHLAEPVGTQPQDLVPGIIPILIVNY
jgi:hypothetical protein